ncbi:MAG: hypothetical protein JW750_05215, partial [Anaerolineaceae bacterium]|nr:hypothetical protein [Anaerolineaceae bacterium]
MQTRVDTPPELRQKIISLAQMMPVSSRSVPERFINILKNHHATRNELDANQLPLKNPLIVALGDSVTAGAFEGSKGLPQQLLDQYFDGKEIEHVIDLQSVYHQLFRDQLAQQYRQTALSVINSGICGDHVVGMLQRLERDVIQYQPDLILLNASLNGPDDLTLFQHSYRKMIERLINETNADLILLTPNHMTRVFMGNLEQRAAFIREIAAEKSLPLADTYAVWSMLLEHGISLDALLANRINHPTA